MQNYEVIPHNKFPLFNSIRICKQSEQIPFSFDQPFLFVKEKVASMKLLNLDITNWACHDSLDIDLSRGLQIEGRNGTGKSSILEAIRFVFAESAAGYKTRIKNGTRSSAVKLKFEKEGNIYTLEKKLYIDKSSTAHLLINSTQIADNPTSVYNQLQNILSENVIDKLLYVPQGGLTDLINNLRRKGGRQELDSLLGLDKFESIYMGIGNEINSKSARSEIALNQFAKYPEDAENFYSAEIGKLRENINDLNNYANEKKNEKRSIDSRIEALRTEIEKSRVMKIEKEELEKRINELRLEITGMKITLEQINGNLESIEKKKSEIRTLLNTEKKLEKYVPMRNLLYEVKKNEDRFIELNGLEDDIARLKRLEQGLEKKEGIESQCEKRGDNILELERLIAMKKQQLEEQNDYLKNLHSLTKKAKCPRCGQRLTKEHTEKEQISAKDAIEEIAQKLKNLDTSLRKVKVEFEYLKKELEIIQKNEILATRLKDEIERKKGDKEIVLNRVNELRNELTKMSYSCETIDFVESRIKELNEIQGRINAFNEELSEEDSLQTRRSDLENQMSKLIEGEEKSRNKLTEFRFDGILLEALQKDREHLQENSYMLSAEIDKCGFKTEGIQNSINELEIKKSEFLNLKKQSDNLIKEINLMGEAMEVFHTNKGVVKYLRERYISRLSSLLTYYFKRINQNKKYNEIFFDKDYNIEIKTTEGNLLIDQLSGGEKIQVAIALRIALIDLLSPIRLLILDEPFGSLDKEHREILGEALNKLATDGQLILVTHVTVDSLNLPERLDLGGY